VIVISIFIISKAFHENELNLALSSARSAGERIALENNVVLEKIDYSASNTLVVITPVFSVEKKREWVREIAERVKNVLAPNSALDENNCFKTTRQFCVS